MTSVIDICTLRELAHRDADGLNVTLMWDAEDNRAFHHPYVYRDQAMAV